MPGHQQQLLNRLIHLYRKQYAELGKLLPAPGEPWFDWITDRMTEIDATILILLELKG